MARLAVSQPPHPAIKMALRGLLHNLDSRQTQHRVAYGTNQAHESQGSAPGSTLNWIENFEQWIPLQAGPGRPATSPL